jgi:hypothetical protein
MLKQANNINEKDLDLLPITDDVDVVVKHISDFYSDTKGHELRPNYEL